MPRRGNRPREPRPGVYRPGRQPVNTRRVFTGLINNQNLRISPLLPPGEGRDEGIEKEVPSFHPPHPNPLPEGEGTESTSAYVLLMCHKSRRHSPFGERADEDLPPSPLTQSMKSEPRFTVRKESRIPFKSPETRGLRLPRVALQGPFYLLLFCWPPLRPVHDRTRLTRLVAEPGNLRPGLIRPLVERVNEGRTDSFIDYRRSKFLRPRVHCPLAVVPRLSL
jgi:hypothetical protein